MTLSLSIELNKILGETLAQEIISLVDLHDPYKKYMASDRGKIARKKRNDKYYLKHGKPTKGDATDVQKQLNEHFADMFCADASELTDEELLIPEKFNPMRYRTGSELWKTYCAEGYPFMTRVRYISLLPELPTQSWYLRDGVKVRIIAYKFNLNDFANL